MLQRIKFDYYNPEIECNSIVNLHAKAIKRNDKLFFLLFQRVGEDGHQLILFLLLHQTCLYKIYCLTFLHSLSHEEILSTISHNRLHILRIRYKFAT